MRTGVDDSELHANEKLSRVGDLIKNLSYIRILMLASARY